MYLALVTGRTLIVPNVLGGDFLKGVDSFKERAMWPGFRIIRINPKQSQFRGVSQFQEERDLSSLSIVEPAFYWRIKRDYSDDVPEPYIVSFDGDSSLREIEERLLSEDITNLPRLIINIEINKNDNRGKSSSNIRNKQKDTDYRFPLFQSVKKRSFHEIELSAEKADHLFKWASDSVGPYQNYLDEKENYLLIPKINRNTRGQRDPKLAETVIQYIRPCKGILEPIRGNRSCFDKCK